MILMAVGDEKAAQLFQIADEVGNVGNHQIYAVHIVLRKSQTAVHNNHIFAILQNGHVLSNFVQSP